MARSDFADWGNDFMFECSGDRPPCIVPLFCIGVVAAMAGGAYVQKALEPTREEQDEAIATISPEEKIQLQLNYNRVLLKEFDYGSSLFKAHENALEHLPSKRNKALHYFAKQYAAYRLAQARKELIPIGRDDDRVIYNTDFPEKLRAEVAVLEKEMQNQMNAQMNQPQVIDHQTKPSAPQAEIDTTQVKMPPVAQV